MHVLKSEAPLIVYIDVKSPYAFIAIKPTLALEKEVGANFDWRPLTLDIPSYLGSAKKVKGEVVSSSGRSTRTWNAVRYSYMDARRYAERQGLVLKGTEKIWDSTIANIAILWVTKNERAKMASFLEVVFQPFWRRELDIEDIAVIEQCLKAAGVDASGFAAFANGEGRELHDQLNAQFHANGVYGVPTFVMDEDVYQGREHIPYIRWRLTGQVGPAPDIAYEISPC